MPPSDALPPPWQRLLALSGVAFAPIFVIGWLTSSGNTPNYTAGDQAWTNWAHGNHYKGRISAFAMLLTAFIFLYFMDSERAPFAESQLRGSA